MNKSSKHEAGGGGVEKKERSELVIRIMANIVELLSLNSDKGVGEDVDETYFNEKLGFINENFTTLSAEDQELLKEDMGEYINKTRLHERYLEGKAPNIKYLAPIFGDEVEFSKNARQIVDSRMLPRTAKPAQKKQPEAVLPVAVENFNGEVSTENPVVAETEEKEEEKNREKKRETFFNNMAASLEAATKNLVAEDRGAGGKDIPPIETKNRKKKRGKKKEKEIKLKDMKDELEASTENPVVVVTEENDIPPVETKKEKREEGEREIDFKSIVDVELALVDLMEKLKNTWSDSVYHQAHNLFLRIEQYVKDCIEVVGTDKELLKEDVLNMLKIQQNVSLRINENLRNEREGSGDPQEMEIIRHLLVESHRCSANIHKLFSTPTHKKDSEAVVVTKEKDIPPVETKKGKKKIKKVPNRSLPNGEDQDDLMWGKQYGGADSTEGPYKYGEYQKREPQNVVVEKPVEEKTNEPQVDALPVETPQTSQQIRLIKSVGDLFKPRDISDPIPDHIANDVGFNNWLTDTMHAHRVPTIEIKDLLTEERLFGVYEKQKSRLDEIEKALDLKILDTMFEIVSIDSEDIQTARKLWFNRFKLAVLNEELVGVDELEGFVNKVRELVEKNKTIAEMEAVLNKKPGGEGLMMSNGKITPENVYLSLNRELPGIVKIQEFVGFIEDMEKNYDFYRGDSKKEDPIAMYRRYKHSRQTNSEEGNYHRGKISLFDKLKITWKARFGSDEDDADDVKRFMENIYNLQRQEIVWSNRGLGEAQIFKKRNELKAYLDIAKKAVYEGQDPENQTFVNLNVPNQQKAKGGLMLFKSLYKPYTEARAMDVDMQEKALHQRNFDVFETEQKQDHLGDLKKSIHPLVMRLKEDPANGDIFKSIQYGVKMNVAIEKLHTVERKLQDIKKSSTQNTKGSAHLSSTHFGQKHRGSGDVAEIQALFAYAQDFFENYETFPEDELLYRKVSMLYIDTMLRTEGGFNPNLHTMLIDNIETYKKIADDSETPYIQKIDMFTALIESLKNQTKAKTLTPLQLVNLTGVIREFEFIKNTIKK